MTESNFSSDGFRIVPFGKGRNAIQSVNANELVRALNMLGAVKIVRGKEDKIFYADGGIVVQLKESSSTSVSGDTVDLIVCNEGNEATYRLYGSLLE